jgi:PKD repeat protein
MKRILSLVTALAAWALGTNALAAFTNFTAGNLVIYRVGDGVQTVTNIGNSVFLDEYTTNGTLVQSLLIRTNYFGANSPLIASGTASAEGEITRSVDGRFIMLTGYGATLGQFTNFSLPSTYSTEAPRVVGLVDGNGNVDTTTVQTNSLASSESIRSAASTDGTNIWFSGNTSGIRYTTRGSPLATQLSTFVSNIRQLNIFSRVDTNGFTGIDTNQLYFSDQSGSAIHIGTVTNGLPTTAGSFLATLPGLPTSSGSPYAFVLFKLAVGTNAFDTLYVADDTTNAVLKYALIGGTNWTSSGSITASGARGLTGNTEISGGTTIVHLYITTGAGTGGGLASLYTYTDRTGYNVDPVNNADGGDANQYNPVFLFGVNFRGIAFAPVGSEPPLLGQISVGPILGLFSGGMTGCTFAATQTFSVANPGTNSVNWSATTDVNWVTLSPASGSVASGAVTLVTASFNANAGGLSAGTNTATITFTNNDSPYIGTTTRAVRLILDDQRITPSADFTLSGQPGGPFTPPSQVYTLTNGGIAINWTASKTANWISLSATAGLLGGCAGTSITVSTNANANALAAGFYSDVISFSNATAATLIDTRNVNLQVGALYFCDDFSTYNSGDLVGQQGWAQNPSSATLPLQVSGGQVVIPGGQTGDNQDAYKNFVQTWNQTVYLGAVVTVSNPPASSSTGPSFFLCMGNYTNGWSSAGPSFANYRFSARAGDTGNSNFVFSLRTTGQATATNTFGTTILSTGTAYRVIIRTDPIGSNGWVYVNPTAADPATQTEYLKCLAASGTFGPATNVGCVGISQYQSGSAPIVGCSIGRVCVSTNYAEVYNSITPGCTPPMNNFIAVPTLGAAPLPVTFSDNATGTIASNYTDFGDGGSTNNVFPTPTNFVHQYTAPGTYLVTNIEWGCGSVCTSYCTITVLSQYDWWASNYFGCATCPQALPGADPLGKGIVNSNQWLLGLDPTNPASVFRIISVVLSNNNNDAWITWKTAGRPSSRTNVLQGATGSSGGYSNNFHDVSTNIVINVNGDTTATDRDQGGAATNRYYRIRLVP